MSKRTSNLPPDVTDSDVENQANGTGSTGRKKLTRRGRFLEYAPKRTNRVLKAINALANCFDASGYEWDASEAAKIAEAVNAAKDRLLDRIDGAKQGKSEFTL